MSNSQIHIYTQIPQGEAWLSKYGTALPVFTCVLGFTETALIPEISAAGLTPDDRKYTACADAEFLYYGAKKTPRYSLPPLTDGASPVLISRAIVEELKLPLYIFNAGLPQPPNLPAIDLGGIPAFCLSTGKAMKLEIVRHLFEQGLIWGEKLAQASNYEYQYQSQEQFQNQSPDKYLVLSECVVGGTTTALAILTGLGLDAAGKVNSSHPTCNHAQKWQIVQQGLEKLGKRDTGEDGIPSWLPLELVAAVGDPMQVVVAGMAIAASRICGVMLAGGTQMLAVYALARALAQTYNLEWQPRQIVVGTTRWVAEDATGATVELAQLIGDIPLIATQLNFHNSRYPQLRAYEQGFVKEGVGAGAACIAAHLRDNWQQEQLLKAIELQISRLESLTKN
ncbi:nicotinate mononucleotide-dependent phosphoribosyltransferase CobT [Calothrix sp. UHCC 0171]|uniref:nicotinate mononucleotide-dependent phosphoribosyltransferase CobT n=1 Tax=Calothrix sp. UHCC 0171 TaxID=3110245 RepID=UPI002B1EF08F|nr:TIGR00303 family protein [Calothrix sp. UHCC 0171]MEA5569695.1 TIGR00303 family protein [Calothrix sp. UHCC 0171]